MKEWQAIFLVLLVGLPFLIYVSQSSLWDTDSYFTLLNVCKQYNLPGDNQIKDSFVQSVFFSFFPCNIFAIKIILFFVCLASVFLIAKIGELFDKENGWLAGLFIVLFTSSFVFTFFKFENDTFAFPLLLVGLWFLIKAKLDVYCSNLKLSAFFFIGCAGLLWQGAIVYLIVLGFGWWPALLLAIIIIWIIGIGSLSVFFPNPFVKESAALLGLKQPILWFAVPSNVFFWVESLFLVIVGLLNTKFLFLAMPFLAIGAMQFFVKQHKLVKILLLLAGFCLYALFVWQLFTPQLAQNDWKAMQFAINESARQGLPLQNDWSVGYQIAWLGGPPGQWGGGWVNSFKPNSIVLTYFKQPDCELIKDFGQYKIWRC